MFSRKRCSASSALAAALMPLVSHSQTPPDAVGGRVPARLDEIVVTGNPLRDKDFIAPVVVLKDEELLVRRAGTLGDTLNGLPGVSATHFGPNASRPIIRGLDGDRIRILSNFGAAFDASSLSPDHNPAVDPLIVERIEVLRGPAALLYGGTAIGGVVNVIDRRIAREPLKGFGGAVESRFGGAERERAFTAALDAGNGPFAVHADGFSRDTSDYEVPSAAGLGSRVANSQAQSDGGAMAATLHGKSGYLGLTHSRYRTNYGTVAEAAVTIDMEQDQASIEGEWRAATGPVRGVTARAGRTTYRHTEFEGGEAGTVFDSKGRDMRIEARHAPLGAFNGVIGVQAERSEFSALGEEAFVPSTRSRSSALFLVEEWSVPAWKLSLGLRSEKSRVESAGADSGSSARFGAPSSRSFDSDSASIGAVWRPDRSTSIYANASRNQRAPAYYELYADGPHIATAAYEVGDPGLAQETSTAIDLGFEWKPDREGRQRVKLAAFSNRFDQFITLRRTGIDRDAEGNGQGTGVIDCGDGTSMESGCAAQIFPEFRFEGVKARLRGFEVEANWRLIERPGTFDLELKADFTRADDLTRNEPLPRIAPLRLRVAGAFGLGALGARIECERAARQHRAPSSDNLGATPGHTLWNASFSYTWKRGNQFARFFVKGTNLGDRLAYQASAIDTIRALAPVPGRALKAGVQFSF